MDPRDIITAETFFNQTDSFYIRIKFLPEDLENNIPEGGAWKFEVWNEINEGIRNNSLPQAAYVVPIIGRGLVELGINNPQHVYSIGQRAFALDNVHNTIRNTEKEQIMLQTKAVAGSA